MSLTGKIRLIDLREAEASGRVPPTDRIYFRRVRRRQP
jgi:hypothetical protein